LLFIVTFSHTNSHFFKNLPPPFARQKSQIYFEEKNVLKIAILCLLALKSRFIAELLPNMASAL